MVKKCHNAADHGFATVVTTFDILEWHVSWRDENLGV